jgi:hypothetical protein
LSSAITGSSPTPFGLTSFLPGISPTVSTVTTPAALLTGSRSSEVTRPAAIGAEPTARWSVPIGSRMSSV